MMKGAAITLAADASQVKLARDVYGHIREGK